MFERTDTHIHTVMHACLFVVHDTCPSTVVLIDQYQIINRVATVTTTSLADALTISKNRNMKDETKGLSDIFVQDLVCKKEIELTKTCSYLMASTIAVPLYCM